MSRGLKSALLSLLASRGAYAFRLRAGRGHADELFQTSLVEAAEICGRGQGTIGRRVAMTRRDLTGRRPLSFVLVGINGATVSGSGVPYAAGA